MSEKLQADPDCCSAWLEHARTFRWKELTPNPSFLVLPEKDGEVVRTCPSCGASRGAVLMDRQRLERAGE